MLVDASLLIYAADESSPQHRAAREWLEGAIDDPYRVGIPWHSLLAFVRISTHPRAMAHPLPPDEAVSRVEDWLAAETVWTPVPGPGFAAILAGLVRDTGATGNLIPDAHLAALALEHGLTVQTTDTDFARFPGLRWRDPLRA